METRVSVIRMIASREAQDRFVVHGTQDEYLLPEDLVNDALEFVRLVEVGRIGSNLSVRQRERLNEPKEALLVVRDALEVEIDNEQLIARDLNWAKLREAAQRFVVEYDQPH